MVESLAANGNSTLGLITTDIQAEYPDMQDLSLDVRFKSPLPSIQSVCQLCNIHFLFVFLFTKFSVFFFIG
jgi:hypothetical protein